MKESPESDQSPRQALLDQLASITTMRPGTLAEEYRDHPTPGGGATVRLGPYFKHQVWQYGRNITRRVPVAEAAILKEDIEAAKRFRQITDQLAELNIQHTVALRAAQSDSTPEAAEKKTSRTNASPKNTAKRSTSSPGRTTSSRKDKGSRR